MYPAFACTVGAQPQAKRDTVRRLRQSALSAVTVGDSAVNISCACVRRRRSKQTTLAISRYPRDEFSSVRRRPQQRQQSREQGLAPVFAFFCTRDSVQARVTFGDTSEGEAAQDAYKVALFKQYQKLSMSFLNDFSTVSRFYFFQRFF